jgi:diguanylate cyclase (GGDEF)-like protein
MNAPMTALADSAGQRRLVLARNRLGAASLILAGVSSLFVALSTGAGGAPRSLAIAYTTLACAWGTVILRRASRVSDRTILATAAVAQLGLTGLALARPALEVSSGLLGYTYLWTCVYVAYYFPRRSTVPYVAATAVLYAGWLAFTTPVTVGIARGAAVSCLLAVLVFGLGWYRHQVDRLLQQLWRESRFDQLTGLLNRRGFFEAGGAAIADAARRSGSVALLALDLDHFKLLNDGHGHAAGDAALAGFGALLGDRCRTQDIAGRLGGEEFAVLLADTDLEAAVAIAERLRAAVTGIPAARPLAVSQGVAILHPAGGACLDDLLDELLRRADRALYRAKDNGRNRVCADGVAINARQADERSVVLGSILHEDEQAA